MQNSNNRLLCVNALQFAFLGAFTVWNFCKISPEHSYLKASRDMWAYTAAATNFVLY